MCRRLTPLLHTTKSNRGPSSRSRILQLVAPPATKTIRAHLLLLQPPRVALAAVVFHREASTNKPLPNATSLEDNRFYRHQLDHHRHWVSKTRPRAALHNTVLQ